jgi:hypothetical protein
MVDNNPETCNLEVVTVDEDSNGLAYTIMPHSDGFNGTIKVNILRTFKQLLWQPS